MTAWTGADAWHRRTLDSHTYLTVTYSRVNPRGWRWTHWDTRQPHLIDTSRIGYGSALEAIRAADLEFGFETETAA